METLLRIISLIIYFVLGTFLAYRWVVAPSAKSSKINNKLGLVLCILVCWTGVFILGQYQTRISIEYFDSADFPEDKGLSATIAYDGVGNTMFALFFGWILAFICIGLAKLFKRLFMIK